MTVKDKLVSKCSGIILSVVRVKGRVTWISDECGINRKFLNRRNLRLLRFHQLVRLLYSTSSWMSREKFEQLGARLFAAIWDYNNRYDDRFYE